MLKPAKAEQFALDIDAAKCACHKCDRWGWIQEGNILRFCDCSIGVQLQRERPNFCDVLNRGRATPKSPKAPRSPIRLHPEWPLTRLDPVEPVEPEDRWE